MREAAGLSLIFGAGRLFHCLQPWLSSCLQPLDACSSILLWRSTMPELSGMLVDAEEAVRYRYSKAAVAVEQSLCCPATSECT